jgi:PHD/YefM family antitoxin component YafN of YafNO toxin-antitoxin module
MNTIAAGVIKRSGISAVDRQLAEGPVHVITHNEPRYVIMSEAQYRAQRDELREAAIARVHAVQADLAAGRGLRFDNVDDLMAAIEAAEDDEDTP